MARRKTETNYGLQFVLLAISTPFTVLCLGKIFALTSAILFGWAVHDVIIQQPHLWVLWTFLVVICNIYWGACINEDRLYGYRRDI
tara:strand:- start:467 stop:724 length:258 start_codon:yes stop_codon:yes gene_type:complete